VVKKPSYEELEQRVKELEVALGDSELERTTILDLQPYHSVIQSLDNRIIWANRAAFESVGVSREDLIGRYCYEIWPQRTCPCPDCPVIKSVQTGKPQSIEKTTPDGRKWHIRSYPIRNNRGQITRALEVTEDITELKQAEEALRKNEERFRTTFDNAAIGMALIANDGCFMKVNHTLCRILGYSEEELLGKTWVEITNPDDLPGCYDWLKRVKAGAQSSYEKRFIHKLGYLVWIEVSSSLVRDSHGRIQYYISLFQDIMSRKQAEEALRESEGRYRNIFKNIQDVYYEVTLDGIILEASPSIEDVSLYKREEIIGKSLSDIYVDPKNRDEFLKKLLKNGKVTDYEALMIDKDGSQVPCSITAKLFCDKQGNPLKIIGSLRNITQRKRAEEHINILTQKLMRALESERQRISRDLHDQVAQDLSAVKIGFETLFDHEPATSPEIRRRVSELSGTLQESIKAVRDVSYDLGPPALDEMGLVETLVQYCNDFSENHGINVDFHSTGMKKLPLDFDTEINLYRLIQEGLTNIKKHADTDHVTIKLVAAFPDIILRIEDNGKGFNVQKRMATLTKEKRMGIHSMVQRAKLLHGEMEIQSRPMQGTKISIRLPYKDNNSGSKEKHIDNRRPSPFQGRP
jgi:PAS domain S-box-containing protein